MIWPTRRVAVQLTRSFSTIVLMSLFTASDSLGFCITKVPIYEGTTVTYIGALEHQGITVAGLTDIRALHDAGGRHLQFQRSALVAIQKANVETDDDQAPHRHFDNETFGYADDRIVALRSYVIALAFRAEFESARAALGTALHTIQDFYSHSNWIEQGNRSPYPAVGSGTMVDPPITAKACSDRDAETLVGGAALTSGYYEDQKLCGDKIVHPPVLFGAEVCDLANDRACPGNCRLEDDVRGQLKCACETPGGAHGDPRPAGWIGDDLIPPEGKCLHGQPVNKSYYAGKGINKDCQEVDSADARTARHVATLATTDFWISIREEILREPLGEYVLCRLFGYDEDHCRCGNRQLDDAEECDDGGLKDNDGCDAACQIEPGWQCSIEDRSFCEEKCGDGMLVGAELGPERCDDGYVAPGDGCSETCTVEPGWRCTGRPSVCDGICGDHNQVGREECDDGHADDLVCNSECKNTFCGDGIRNGAPREECDGQDGMCGADQACSPNCRCVKAPSLAIDFANPVVTVDGSLWGINDILWSDQFIDRGVRLYNLVSGTCASCLGFRSWFGYPAALDFSCSGCPRFTVFGRPVIVEAPGGGHRILSLSVRLLSFGETRTVRLRGYRGLLPPPGPGWSCDSVVSCGRERQWLPFETGAWGTGWPQVDFRKIQDAVAPFGEVVQAEIADPQGFDFVTIGEGPFGVDALSLDDIWLDLAPVR